MRCPKCGSQNIGADASCTVMWGQDLGAWAALEGTHEVDKDAAAWCGVCGTHGVVWRFEECEWTELAEVLRAASVSYSLAEMESTILAAHFGTLSRFVTISNMHLFRRYRNQVSGDPKQMLQHLLPEDQINGGEKSDA